VLYLHKLLPSLFLPIGITLVLVGAGLLLRKRILCWLGVGLLYLFSTGFVSGKIMGWAEGAGSRLEVEEVEPADAVVVLSGMLKDRKDVKLGEWSDAVDRFEGGVELFQAGKGPVMIFTGGHVPWRPEDRPEGEILKERAVKLGVPEDKIQVTGKVGNTAEEATAVKDTLRHAERKIAKSEIRKAENSSSRVAGDVLLATNSSPLKSRTQNPASSQQPTANGPQPTTPVGSERWAVGSKPKIILVTSAFHMRRARMLFERQGFEVEPFPVDFQTSDRPRTTILSFLPKAEFLEDSETAMREGVGILYYSIFKR
jgi:uncharacterized SAM-binding protein YcdF (DUF218 family)